VLGLNEPGRRDGVRRLQVDERQDEQDDDGSHDEAGEGAPVVFFKLDCYRLSVESNRRCLHRGGERVKGVGP
jgi:hypothetical protein